MKKSYLLITFTFAAMLVVPAVYGQSDNVEMRDIVEWQAGWARDCPEVRDRDGDDPHIVWKCNAEAIIAWCFKNIVMSHDANEQQKQNARYKECGNREGYKELLHNHPGYGAVSTVHKPGDKVRFQLPQNAKRATVYYSYCPYIQYVPIMNVDSGTFYCDPIFEFETSLDSSASAAGNQDIADADDLYERLFGELESRLSVLLGDSGFSDEVFGNLLELLGSELSFEDALGNIGKGHKDSGDQGSKQSSLSVSSAACKEYLDAAEQYFELQVAFSTLPKNPTYTEFNKAQTMRDEALRRLRVTIESVHGDNGAFSASHNAWLDEAERIVVQQLGEDMSNIYSFGHVLKDSHYRHLKEIEKQAFLKHAGVCGY